MASYTPNLNLILPVGTEKVSRQIINSNNGIIDSAFGDIVSPTVQGVSTLAELKTYLLAVAGSAEARKNVPVQFNLTAAASPFNSGLYTGIMQKETNGAFSVLCHGYNGGVVEVQYASSTWTIMNLTSEISSLNSKIAQQDIMNPILLTSTDNMDNVGPGIYYQTNIDMPANSPSEQYNAAISVYRSSPASTGVTQIWISNNTGKTWKRSRFSSNDAFTSWKSIEDNINTLSYTNVLNNTGIGTAQNGATVETSTNYTNAHVCYRFVALHLRIVVPTITEETLVFKILSSLKPKGNIGYVPAFGQWDRTINGLFRIDSDGNIYADITASNKDLVIYISYVSDRQ